jgi:RNA recognition motif-containing protein
MRIYVGNLSREVTEKDLREEFRPYGEVDQVTIMKDRSKTVSKGFGYVEMRSQTEGKNAIAGLHMKEMKGQSLDIKEEAPRPPHHRSGGAFSGRKGRGGRRQW